MKIGIIGCDGIPARYGGFETFAEQVVPEIAAMGCKVLVVGSSLGRSPAAPQSENVEIINLPLRANGAGSVLFDIVSFLVALPRCDAILILGVSAGLLMPVFKLLAPRTRIVINVDGLEARREKWRGIKRWFIATSERVAIRHADGVVSDNQGITSILHRAYSRQIVTIAYGHNHVLKLPAAEAIKLLEETCQLKPRTYGLTVARIEPENNIKPMIDGFLASKLEKYLIIGNFSATSYGASLKSEYREEPRLILMDACYDRELLAAYRGQCQVYLHGHSVGGTNPSLVEMLPYGCPVVAFDCAFNRCTLQDTGAYFKTVNGLTKTLNSSDLAAFVPADGVRWHTDYLWPNIARRYVEVLTG